MAHLLAILGWVDFDLRCFSLCLFLRGLMGNWQVGKVVEHPKSKSTQPRFARRWATLYNASHHVMSFAERDAHSNFSPVDI